MLSLQLQADAPGARQGSEEAEFWQGAGGCCGEGIVVLGLWAVLLGFGSGEPCGTGWWLEPPVREGWESFPQRALKCVLVLCLIKGRLHGLVLSVPLSDFLQMWLISFIFVPSAEHRCKTDQHGGAAVNDEPSLPNNISLHFTTIPGTASVVCLVLGDWAASFLCSAVCLSLLAWLS